MRNVYICDLSWDDDEVRVIIEAPSLHACIDIIEKEYSEYDVISIKREEAIIIRHD